MGRKQDREQIIAATKSSLGSGEHIRSCSAVWATECRWPGPPDLPGPLPALRRAHRPAAHPVPSTPTPAPARRRTRCSSPSVTRRSRSRRRAASLRSSRCGSGIPPTGRSRSSSAPVIARSGSELVERARRGHRAGRPTSPSGERLPGDRRRHHGVRAFAVDEHGTPIGWSYREFPQHFPQPGWVEHDPDEIWTATLETLAEVQSQARRRRALGRRDRHHQPARDGGRVGPAHGPAAAPRHRLAGPAHRGALRRAPGRRASSRSIRERTGLVLDSYFSATKLEWLLTRRRRRRRT